MDFSDLLFEVNDALLDGDGAIESELRQDVAAEIAKEEERIICMTLLTAG